MKLQEEIIRNNKIQSKKCNIFLENHKIILIAHKKYLGCEYLVAEANHTI